jgi:hypothetical protein
MFGATLARRATGWTAIALLMLCLLPVTPGALAQTPTMVLGVPLPDRVGGLSHQALSDFETRSPGMGYGVKFVRPDWAIDVYIYDLQMKAIPDDPASAAIQAALAEAKDEITAIEKRGDYSGVTLKNTFTIADAKGRGHFVCAEYNYLHKGRGVELDSFLCLAGARGKFFQMRMDTVKSAHDDEARRFVEAWARAWMPVLWPG